MKNIKVLQRCVNTDASQNMYIWDLRMVWRVFEAGNMHCT